MLRPYGGEDELTSPGAPAEQPLEHGPGEAVTEPAPAAVEPEPAELMAMASAVEPAEVEPLEPGRGEAVPEPAPAAVEPVELSEPGRGEAVPQPATEPEDKEYHGASNLHFVLFCNNGLLKEHGLG